MWEKIAAVDWAALLERGSNDRIVALFTSPVGLGVLGALLLLSVVLKRRVTFVVLSAALAVGFLARSTVSSGAVGPGRSMFLFAGGAIAIAAFVIYFLFIREE